MSDDFGSTCNMMHIKYYKLRISCIYWLSELILINYYAVNSHNQINGKLCIHLIAGVQFTDRVETCGG